MEFFSCLRGFPPAGVGYLDLGSARELGFPLSPIVGVVFSYPSSSPDSDGLGDWKCSVSQIVEFIVAWKVRQS